MTATAGVCLCVGNLEREVLQDLIRYESGPSTARLHSTNYELTKSQSPGFETCLFVVEKLGCMTGIPD